MNKIRLLAIVTPALLCAACHAPQGGMTWQQRWGESVADSAATKTVVIAPDTRYVNVTGGEVVKFVEGNKSFAWNFDGPYAYAFELNRVAPPGVLDHRVMAYVDADPYYNGR